ncbi:DUF6478 family protein [Paracoccus albus]|uniref:DUF6478 family protein n=1 Tax=Paracoccus albus TaxID=3017784 RepID=UPI0022F0D2DF|nr:DUF6478 family protein [Paracoccus albus]WBU61797.1 DUF6478 family protein [Paracoccus albus]
MGFRPYSWLDQMARRIAASSWASIGKKAPAMRPAHLRALRADAAGLSADLDRFLMMSAERVHASRAELATLPLPAGTDWRWRPEFLDGAIRKHGIAAPQSGAKLTEGAAIWHDCPASALIFKQIRNVDSTDLAAFGLQLETFNFSGSFLSLSVDLPEHVLNGLTREHIIRLELVVRMERDQEVYARLNIGSGPNTEEVIRHLGSLQPGNTNSQVIEFDLALTEMNEKRLDKAWLDLIFEKPVMNAASIREMIFSRHLRANV